MARLRISVWLCEEAGGQRAFACACDARSAATTEGWLLRRKERWCSGVREAAMMCAIGGRLLWRGRNGEDKKVKLMDKRVRRGGQLS